MPLSPEAITARIVVERIEVHHSPVSGFERLQAMSALAQAPLRPDRPPATSDRPAATGDDTADAVLTSERRADAATGGERVAGSDHGAHAERWRPDRRGDMFGGSGGRRGWDSFSPGPSAAAVSAVAGPEPVRQDFATARDAAPVPGTLVAPIAGSLLAAVEDMQAAEVASAGPAAGTHQAAPGGTPVKALELTLLPDQLGPIAVRMRLENGALSVTMKAHSHGDTAALVVERDAIEDTLRKSGYAIDAVTVSIAPEPAARPTDSQLSQQTAHHGGADIGGGRSEATGAGGRDRDGHRPPSTDVPAGRPGSDDASQGPEQNPRRGPGLYV